MKELYSLEWLAVEGEINNFPLPRLICKNFGKIKKTKKKCNLLCSKQIII